MKKLALPFLLLFILGPTFGQQDPIITQYLFDKLPINPAYSGSYNALSLNLIDRYQWVGLKDGPNTITFTVNSYLPNPHLGAGLFAYRDALGPTTETGVKGVFAYKIIFPKGKLSFGVSFGFKYLDVDWSALDPKNPGDPLLTSDSKKNAVPDADLGIYFYSERYYAGLSSTHLFQNEIDISNGTVPNTTSFSKLLRHFYAIGGVVIPLADDLDLRPAAIIRYVRNSPVQADVDLSLLIHEIFWIGVGYRTEKCVMFMADINITKNLHIGYSYDAWFNELKSYNSGSHEIRIGYDLDIFDLEKMVTPRFF
jgi:type IX secretion system PorP/SprF family membrane protein